MRIMNTSHYLSFWSPEQRGCYFENERRLQHFTRYSQKNCDIECEANRTLDICGCSPLFHPRKRGTLVCGSKKRTCVEHSLLREGTMQDTRKVFCDCRPSCNELEYDVHSSGYKRNWAKYFGNLYRPELHPDPRLFNETAQRYGGLHVSFLTKYTVAVRRDNLFSGIHFVGNIGGLLGLFLGFSILSLVEIVYFIFFRPCYRLYNTRNNKRDADQHHTA